MTRKGALQFMIEEKCFPEADVDVMRSHCVYKMRIPTDKLPSPLQKPEVYNTNDPSLPKGWSSKLLSNGAKRAPKKLIRSPQGQVFTSRRKALEFMMENSEKYSKYEMEKMLQHIGQSSVSIRERSSPTEVKEETAEIKSVISDQSKASEDGQGWLSDPMLPPGWLYNYVVKTEGSERSGHKPLMKFKTAEGDQIETSWKALKFMRSKAKYSSCEIESFVSFYRKKKKSDQEDCIEEAREGDIGNGEAVPDKIESNVSRESSARKTRRVVDSRRFSEHHLLPTGWLLARYELAKGGTLIRFKSPAGETIYSRKKVLEMMKTQGYSRAEMEDVEKITFVKKKEDVKKELQTQESEETLVKVTTSEVKMDDNSEDLEFSLISEETSDELTLDEEAILNLTEDDFEILGHTYSEDFSVLSEETEQTTSEDTGSQHQSEEIQDCDESLEEENASLGPKISYSLEAFHILSEAFNENRIISEADTRCLSDLIGGPEKDVKWFFLKLRHLVRDKNIEDQREQISELLESLTQTPCDVDLITI